MQKRKPTDFEILSALNEIIKENKKQDKKQDKKQTKKTKSNK
jgi:hypothetical protein